jgi:hypothetical protein
MRKSSSYIVILILLIVLIIPFRLSNLYEIERADSQQVNLNFENTMNRSINEQNSIFEDLPEESSDIKITINSMRK